MKKFFPLASILCVIDLLSAFAGSPQIEFEKTVYDFGKVSQVQSVTGIFAFRNTGNALLKLDQLTTSCGCTVATVDPDTLQPGQAGKINFTLTMTSVRSVIENHIVVPSNDPKNPKVELTVKADYVPLFEIEPILVHLDIRQGQKTNVVVKVRRTDGKPLELTKLEPSKDWIKAGIDSTRRPGASEARILIEAKPDGAPRYFTAVVRIFADQESEPALSAVLMGRVIGEVSITPDSVRWNINDVESRSADEREAMLTRRIIISYQGAEQPLLIRNVTSTLKELKLEFVPKQTNKTYELVATLTNLPKSTVHGSIHFETNRPGQGNVEIPVMIAVFGK